MPRWITFDTYWSAALFILFHFRHTGHVSSTGISVVYVVMQSTFVFAGCIVKDESLGYINFLEPRGPADLMPLSSVSGE